MRFSLRRATPGDEPFLYEVFATVRGEQYPLAGLPEQMAGTLLRVQFEARRADYERQYPGSQESVILAHGNPAGILWCADLPDQVRIVDIAILPEFRNRGTGTAAIGSVIGVRQSSHARRRAGECPRARTLPPARLRNPGG